MPRPKLTTTREQFDSLHAALDKTRASSATVKVSRAALVNLLRDHGIMAAALKLED